MQKHELDQWFWIIQNLWSILGTAIKSATWIQVLDLVWPIKMDDYGSNLVMKLTDNIVSRCGFLMFLGQWNSIGIHISANLKGQGDELWRSGNATAFQWQWGRWRRRFAHLMPLWTFWNSEIFECWPQIDFPWVPTVCALNIYKYWYHEKPVA